MKLMLGWLIILTAYSGVASAQCEIPPVIRQILNQPIMQRKVSETKAEKEARAEAIKEALAAHPDDYFLLRAQMRALR
jgi:hypothetical protein